MQHTTEHMHHGPQLMWHHVYKAAMQGTPQYTPGRVDPEL